MAHRKAGGTAKNLRDSNPKYLGIKLPDGANARPGMIIVRQRGTQILPGTNVGMGKDHTLFALTQGKINFSKTKKLSFNSLLQKVKIVNVKPTR